MHIGNQVIKFRHLYPYKGGGEIVIYCVGVHGGDKIYWHIKIYIPGVKRSILQIIMVYSAVSLVTATYTVYIYIPDTLGIILLNIRHIGLFNG